MLGLRQKLLIAFACLFLLLVSVAGLGMAVIGRVSQSFDRIFHENLATVNACRAMGEAAEEMNEGILISLWDGTAPDTVAMGHSASEFENRLRFQQGNVTVRGEQALTDSLTLAWEGFRTAYASLSSSRLPIQERRKKYRLEVNPAFHAIERYAKSIAELNSANILSADGQVRAQAGVAKRAMIFLLSASAALVSLLLFVLGKIILRPIRALTRSAQEIEKGNLDLALEVRSQDELGQLAEAFNAMSARLREFRRTDHAKLVRTQKTTQTAINSLPDAVAVLSPEGMVEMSNAPAQALFGIKPGMRAEGSGHDWLVPLLDTVRREKRASKPQTYESAIQVFRDGEERFFLPHAIPLLDEARQAQGVTVVLADVTDLRKLDEAKSDLLSTVSHELKTRLTSMRMATHLLLDEKIGELNPRQAELLLAAREDTEHLHRIIDGLLDIGRIRSGRLKMDMQPIDTQELVLRAVESVRHAYQDKGVRLEHDLPEELPKAVADPSRIPLVLDNLLSNALKYTRSGGWVHIEVKAIPGTQAEPGRGWLRFQVSDTGSGIPASDLPRVFERFYRGAQENGTGGAGLGLAIAKEVVEAHGGMIVVESREGEGSTFAFTLKSEAGK